MLETDDHTMATTMESVLLDVGSGFFLATPLEIVVEVVIHRHGRIAPFHLEKELSASDRILIPPSQLIGQLAGLPASTWRTLRSSQMDCRAEVMKRWTRTMASLTNPMLISSHLDDCFFITVAKIDALKVPSSNS
jgi:hypothetical protein